MVTIEPIFINTLMISEALIDIFWANSATLMVSGTATSCTIGSVGNENACSGSTACLLCLSWRGARTGVVQTPGLSPGLAGVRFLCPFSSHGLALASGFGFLLGLAILSPGLGAGLCNVPSARLTIGAATTGIASATFITAATTGCGSGSTVFCAVLRLLRSCLTCTSAA